MHDHRVVVDELAQRPEAVPLRPADGRVEVDAVALGTITSKQAKDVFAEILATGAMPDAIIKKHGMAQVSDESVIEAIVDTVIAENPAAIEDFRKGKTNVVGWLTGQVMKKSKGQANPASASSLVQKKLAQLV